MTEMITAVLAVASILIVVITLLAVAVAMETIADIRSGMARLHTIIPPILIAALFASIAAVVIFAMIDLLGAA